MVHMLVHLLPLVWFRCNMWHAIFVGQDFYVMGSILHCWQFIRPNVEQRLPGYCRALKNNPAWALESSKYRHILLSARGIVWLCNAFIHLLEHWQTFINRQKVWPNVLLNISIYSMIASRSCGREKDCWIVLFRWDIESFSGVCRFDRLLAELNE